MNTPATTASDSTYHARHSSRSLRRARRIADNIETQSTVIDVGCNNGITSQYLLDTGKASHVTGVELHAETVDDALRENARFELIEGNVAELQLDRQYDVCVYGAVHHHILNFYGLTAAIETLQKLATHTDRSLFFETGQIAEGGRWGWQRAIRRYFRTDEEHFFYLLRSIEHLVDDFSVIGKFWIHAARRSYLRIDLKPPDTRGDGRVTAFVREIGDTTEGPLGRSRGSKDQSLLPAAETTASPTWFWTGGDSTFVKQYRHHPAAAQVEYDIGRSINADWAVTATGTTDDPGTLVFPFIDHEGDVRNAGALDASMKTRLAAELLAIVRDARAVRPGLAAGALLPAPASASLIDLCDLNPNNVLLQKNGDSVRLRVVDFEQQGVHYAYRNRLHLSKMLRILKQRRLRAATEWLLGAGTGLLHLLRYQFRSQDERIRHRQPSIASVVVAETRSAGGRLLQWLLSLLGVMQPAGKR